MASLSGADVVLLVVYAAVLWLPGVGIAAALGVRGWTLAASAPLVTYGLTAVTVPWLSTIGFRWTPVSAAALASVSVAACVLLGVPLRRWAAASPRAVPDDRPSWPGRTHLACGAAVAVAGLFGADVILAGLHGMGAISQDWDAVFHANGIRYIADTGDGGLSGMSHVYQSGPGSYYPNSYHLVAAEVFRLTGQPIPDVLNAQAALLPAMLAVGLVALVRGFGGRGRLAWFTALVSPLATAIPYDLLWRGPLYPFATGVILVPAALLLLRDYLDRPSVCPGLLVAVAMAGLLGLHPSALVTAVVFAVPMLVQRWWQRPRLVPGDALSLVPAVLVSVAAVLPHLRGAVASVDATQEFSWPQDLTPAAATGQVFTFSTNAPLPQWWLAVLLGVGLIGLRSLGRLRFLAAAGFTFAGLYVVAAAYGTHWGHQLTGIWWNDRWRLAGIATMAFLPVVGHGLVRTADAVAAPLARLSARMPGRASPAVAAPVGVLAVAVALVAVSDLGYVHRNVQRMSYNTAPVSTVTPGEVKAYAVLAGLVRPGERVLNDRYDGSAWMYALDGIHPVAGHFANDGIGPAAQLLGSHFDEYDTNPQVRAAARALNVRWVIVGPGFVRPGTTRQAGLAHLDQVAELRLVYQADGVRIYRLLSDGSPAAP